MVGLPRPESPRAENGAQEALQALEVSPQPSEGLKGAYRGYVRKPGVLQKEPLTFGGGLFFKLVGKLSINKKGTSTKRGENYVFSYSMGLSLCACLIAGALGAIQNPRSR